MSTVEMPSFIQECLAAIELVARRFVTVAVVPTVRKVFEVPLGLEQVRWFIERLKRDPRINVVTLESIVEGGVLWAGDLTDIRRVTDFLKAAGVDVVVVKPVNYGDEESAAAIAAALNNDLGIPIYTYVSPELPIYADGRRPTDDGCGIFPMRYEMLKRMGMSPAYLPKAQLDSPRFNAGLNQLVQVGGGLRAARSVRGIQVGEDQPTFFAIHSDKHLMERLFGLRVEPVDAGEFRDMLKKDLETPPVWLNEVLAYIGQWIDFSQVVGEFPNTAKLTALGFGRCLELLARKQSNAISINCWAAIMRDEGLRFMVCGINGLLYQHGVMAPCETDWNGAVASALNQGMVIGEDPTNRLNFFADLTRVEQNGDGLLWHCGPFPPRLCEGGYATCRKGWIIPVEKGCAGLLDGPWGKIGAPITATQLRSDENGVLTLVAWSARLKKGPRTIGTHCWYGTDRPEEFEDWTMNVPFDHHNSGMHGVNLLPALKEAARWMRARVGNQIVRVACTTFDNAKA